MRIVKPENLCQPGLAENQRSLDISCPTDYLVASASEGRRIEGMAYQLTDCSHQTWYIHAVDGTSHMGTYENSAPSQPSISWSPCPERLRCMLEVSHTLSSEKSDGFPSEKYSQTT
jgi:hypothetical protein